MFIYMIEMPRNIILTFKENSEQSVRTIKHVYNIMNVCMYIKE